MENLSEEEYGRLLSMKLSDNKDDNELFVELVASLKINGRLSDDQFYDLFGRTPQLYSFEHNGVVYDKYWYECESNRRKHEKIRV